MTLAANARDDRFENRESLHVVEDLGKFLKLRTDAIESLTRPCFSQARPGFPHYDDAAFAHASGVVKKLTALESFIHNLKHEARIITPSTGEFLLLPIVRKAMARNEGPERFARGLSVWRRKLTRHIH